MNHGQIYRLAQVIASAILGMADFVEIPDRRGKNLRIGFTELTAIIEVELDKELTKWRTDLMG